MLTTDIRPCLRDTCVAKSDDACWTLSAVAFGSVGNATNATLCPLDLICKQGSTGPICGACDDDHTYNSIKQVKTLFDPIYIFLL